MATYSNYLSELLEVRKRSHTLARVFQHFDGDGDGKLSIEEFKKCLGCFDVLVDDGEIERFVYIDQNSMVRFSQFAQLFESEEDDDTLFQNLRKMKSSEISSKFNIFTLKEKQAKEFADAFSFFDKINNESALGFEATYSTSNLEWMELCCRGSTLLTVFHHFDEDGDGKLTKEEFKNCLGSFDVLVDDGKMERFLHTDQNSKIRFSQFFQVCSSEEDDDKLFQSLRKMKSSEISLKFDAFILKEKAKKMKGERDRLIADILSFFYQNNNVLISAEELEMVYRNRKDHNNDHVIGLNHLYLAPIPEENCSNISKLRDIFLGLTGQAAVVFLAFSPTRPLYVIVAVNALAFFSCYLVSVFAAPSARLLRESQELLELLPLPLSSL